MYVDALKRDAFLKYTIFFLDNIGVMKTYIRVHYSDCWQNKSLL